MSSPVDWRKRWADLEWEHEKKKAELAETRRTLARLMSLIDTGVLVRETSRDAEPGWGIRMLELFTVLLAAKEEINNG